jgi:hypothetical protein
MSVPWLAESIVLPSVEPEVPTEIGLPTSSRRGGREDEECHPVKNVEVRLDFFPFSNEEG